MRMGELARRTGVSPSLLRVGAPLRPRAAAASPAGYRLLSPDDEGCVLEVERLLAAAWPRPRRPWSRKLAAGEQVDAASAVLRRTASALAESLARSTNAPLADVADAAERGGATVAVVAAAVRERFAEAQDASACSRAACRRGSA